MARPDKRNKETLDKGCFPKAREKSKKLIETTALFISPFIN